MVSFAGMSWEPDRLCWRGLTFRLEDPTRPVPGSDGLILWKSRGLVEQYRAFWAERPAFSPRQVFELGVWKGGSVVFWAEALRPDRLVAVDKREGSDSPAFESYLAARTPRLQVHWAVDQSDQGRLRTLLDGAFDGLLDLVIDDASHLYGPTRASFETLFPRLRPGGLYVIEDWAWAHWRGFQGPPPRLHVRFRSPVSWKSSSPQWGAAIWSGRSRSGKASSRSSAETYPRPNPSPSTRPSPGARIHRPGRCAGS
jgi:predicted O-methyltransferase YrrM